MADAAATDNGGEQVPSEQKIVKVTTHEGKEFPVKKKILLMFGMIKNMLIALGDDDQNDEVIPIPNVRAEIFQKILEWCEWHQDDPETSDDESDDEDRDRRIDDIPQWDVKFIAALSRSDTFEMMQACNYLDLPFLLELLAKTVAGWMKGKSVEAIREEFNIPCDYTAEEDERLKKENAWAEEAVLKAAAGNN